MTIQKKKKHNEVFRIPCFSSNLNLRDFLTNLRRIEGYKTHNYVAMLKIQHKIAFEMTQIQDSHLTSRMKILKGEESCYRTNTSLSYSIFSYT